MINPNVSSAKIRQPLRIRKWICFLLFLAPALLQAQRYTYPPVNQVYRDSSLTAFICRFQYAIFQKDAGFLLSVIDPDIKLSFGDAHGLQDFKTMWKPEDPGSPVWSLLSKLISLGGVKSNYSTTNDCYVFPYVFEIEFPPNEPSLDAFNTLVITGSKVNVRITPSVESQKLGQLSHELVRMDDLVFYPKDAPDSLSMYDLREKWYLISTPDNQLKGWINGEYAWSPVDYRLFLEKQNGSWKIVCLIAGD